MRIVLSGGGTGGHITPILTVAAALKKSRPDIELIYIGEKNQISDQIAGESQVALPYYITAGKFRRYRQNIFQTLFDFKTLALNIRDVFRFIIGFFQSLWLLIRLRPKLVFIKGGYVGLPVGLAAWLIGIPVVIHESDATAGLTNRILGHLADRIAVSWPTTNFPMWRHRSPIFTGNPIRPELLDGSRPQALTEFKLQPGRPTVLIMGGSSGAHVINQAISKLLPELLERYQIIHITGKRDIKRFQKMRRQHYRSFEFLNTDQLAQAYAAADVVVCRAGMNTIAELAALAKPAIVIPSPYLAGGHQLKNAELLEIYQAAVVLDQAKLDSQLLLSIEELLGSSDAQTLLRKGMAKIAHPDASQNVSKIILDTL